MKLFPTFRGWWIVFAAFLSLFLHGPATNYLFGILVVPMEQDLGWSRTMLTGAVTVATFIAAGVGLYIGPFFDRHGVRVGMTVSAICGGAALVLLAFMQTPWQYYLLLGLGIGATRAGLENVGPRTAIANWFVRRRAAAFAWASGGRALFGILMVPIISYIVVQTSWRSGWALMGVLELVILVPLLWLIIRRRPEDQGQLPDGDAPAEQRQEAGQRTLTAAEREVQWTRAEAV
ncbi:MAG: MFS transporter, partial [Dehalococcoidia bacterium]